MDSIRPRYTGIGGWLILVAFGLIISPLRMVAFISTDLVPAFRHETWTALTTPGSDAYHHLWAPLLIFELLGNGILLMFGVLVLFFFFSRKRLFPHPAIVYWLSNLAFMVADFVLADLIPAVAKQSDPASQKELVRMVVGCLIWVPYFVVSKRVKATFTE